MADRTRVPVDAISMITRDSISWPCSRRPRARYPHIFIDAAARATDARLWAMALTAILFASIRSADYGLWRNQVWAEWFGILSGSLYLPVEIYKLTRSVSVVKISIILVNMYRSRLASLGALGGQEQR